MFYSSFISWFWTIGSATELVWGVTKLSCFINRERYRVDRGCYRLALFLNSWALPSWPGSYRIVLFRERYRIGWGKLPTCRVSKIVSATELIGGCYRFALFKRSWALPNSIKQSSCVTVWDWCYRVALFLNYHGCYRMGLECYRPVLKRGHVWDLQSHDIPNFACQRHEFSFCCMPYILLFCFYLYFSFYPNS